MVHVRYTVASKFRCVCWQPDRAEEFLFIYLFIYFLGGGGEGVCLLLIGNCIVRRR